MTCGRSEKRVQGLGVWRTSVQLWAMARTYLHRGGHLHGRLLGEKDAALLGIRHRIQCQKESRRRTGRTGMKAEAYKEEAGAHPISRKVIIKRVFAMWSARSSG